MEEILRVEVSGTFNGRDATLSIGLDAESAFEIEDLDTSTAGQSSAVNGEAEPKPESDSADTQTPAEPESPETTDTAGDVDQSDDAENPSGLEELYPTKQFERDDLPPLSAGTKQFKTAELVFESTNGPVGTREITDTLQSREGKDEWDDSKVSSHLYSLIGKDILDREKDEASGKWMYYVTDIGEAAVRYAKRNVDEDDESDEADAGDE